MIVMMDGLSSVGIDGGKHTCGKQWNARYRFRASCNSDSRQTCQRPVHGDSILPSSEITSQLRVMFGSLSIVLVVASKPLLHN